MQISSRFRIIRELGEGGMGVVYEAFDEERKGRVALKVLRNMTAESLVRFKREFRALQDVHHPNLATLGELISEGDQWFFTMDLVEGVDFLTYVRPFDPEPSGVDLTALTPTPASPPVPPSERTIALAPTARFHRARLQPSDDRSALFQFDEGRLRSSLRQLALALAALHEAGLVHRDIKPSNIRITNTGRLVLLDFGLVGDIDLRRARETSDSNLVGTPAYMAPEQATSTPVGPEADWYGVGVMLHEALTGRLPFAGAPLEVLLKKQQSEPLPPSSITKGIPKDLDLLCSALLQSNPKMRPQTDSVLRALDVRQDEGPASRRPSQTQHAPFVGRLAELLALREAYEESQRGAPITVRLEGESGVGKSCIVRRFAETLANDEPELIVLTGRCYERESVPYKAFDGVVDSLARVLARMPKEEAALMLPTKPAPLLQVFPVLRRVEAIARLPRHAQQPMDPSEIRRRAFAAMRELLTRLADQHPLVIVIDDVQWGDADSESLLAEVLRPPEAPGLLLVTTARTVSAPSASTHSVTIAIAPPVDVALPGDVRTIKIGRLPSEEARELAEILLERSSPAGGRGASGGLMSAASIAEEAAGLPLFIDALVRHSALADGPRGPTRLEDALWARVQRLDEPARTLMEILAVAGAPIPQDVLVTAAAMDRGHFARHVASLRVAYLVQTTGMRGPDRIEPYHDRLRVAIRGRLEKRVRVAHHRRLALAFETTGHTDTEMLAEHWSGAGDREQGLRYTVMAADEATRALAFDRAAKLYDRALELQKGAGGARRGPEEENERRALKARLGETLANAGRGALAARAFQAAAKGSKAAESLDLQRRAADQLLRSGHFDKGLALIQSVLAAVGMKLPSTPWRALLSFAVMRLLFSMRGLRFVERDSTQIAPKDLTRVDICWSVAFGLGFVDTIRAASFQVRHLALALRTGEPYRIARALATEVGYLGRGGGRTRARTQRLMTFAIAHAEKTKSPHALGLTFAMSGVAEYLAGEFRQGLEYCDRAELILRDQCTGTAWEIDNARTFALSCIVHLGELRQLRARQPLYLREAMDRGDLFGAVNLRVGHPCLKWLLDDDADGARADVVDAMDQWSKQGFHIEHYYELVALTQADLYAGRGVDAHARIVKSWRPFRKSLLQTVQMLGAMALQLRARSALAAARSAKEDGTVRQLLASAERDARAIERVGMAWARPMSKLLRAGVLATRRTDDAAAVSLLREAIGGFDGAAMALYGAAARRRLGGLLGGDEGSALVRASDAWMTAETVRDSVKMTAMLAPGFEA